VTKPLALLFYENLMPGSQLANRLADMGWRVKVENMAASVPGSAKVDPPMVILAELALRHGDFCEVIRKLKGQPETSHIPVLGWAPIRNTRLQDAATTAGAALVAADSAILDQLPRLIDHVLALD
jgi:PleD family two-component response regulator